PPGDAVRFGPAPGRGGPGKRPHGAEPALAVGRSDPGAVASPGGSVYRGRQPRRRLGRPGGPGAGRRELLLSGRRPAAAARGPEPAAPPGRGGRGAAAL